MLNAAEIYRHIGPAGCAIAIVACAAVYFAIKNYVYLHIVWRDFRRHYPDIEQCSFSKECMDSAGDNPLSCIVQDIVHTHAGHSKDIRAEVAYLFHRNFEQVTREICYLRLISVMSPMLGLLGTIFGMVTIFQTISQSAVPDASLLANGIGEALMTTIMGLCVSIPSLMVYYFLMLRFKGFHIEAVEYSYRALEYVRKRHGTESPVSEEKEDLYA